MLRTKRPSVYLLMHGLLDRGVEPGTASVAIGLVLDHPTEEEDPLDGLAVEWEPSYEPSEEDADWLSQLDVEEAARYAAWVDIREAEARLSRYTDHDLAAARLAVGWNPANCHRQPGRRCPGHPRTTKRPGRP